jgi:hypothetical protein
MRWELCYVEDSGVLGAFRMTDNTLKQGCLKPSVQCNIILVEASNLMLDCF